MDDITFLSPTTICISVATNIFFKKFTLNKK